MQHIIQNTVQPNFSSSKTIQRHHDTVRPNFFLYNNFKDTAQQNFFFREQNTFMFSRGSSTAQPTISTNQVNRIKLTPCRSCWAIKQNHSLKQCLTKKREEKYIEEARLSYRKHFIKKYNLKTKQKVPIKRRQYLKKALRNEIERINKLITNFITPIRELKSDQFKKPATIKQNNKTIVSLTLNSSLPFKKRRITPIDSTRWTSTYSYGPNPEAHQTVLSEQDR